MVQHRHNFLKENWDWTCHFSGKQLALLMLETRLSNKDSGLDKYFKNQGLFWKNVPKSGPVLDFWK